MGNKQCSEERSVGVLEIPLHENGCPWNESATRIAATNGHLECLKYLHENGCLWDGRATYDAAENGHLECLKYLHENGCTWNEWATRSAAKNGQLECLKYLHENGCLWDGRATRIAATNGHLKCLKYLHENGGPAPYGRPWSTLVRRLNRSAESFSVLFVLLVEVVVGDDGEDRPRASYAFVNHALFDSNLIFEIADFVKI